MDLGMDGTRRRGRGTNSLQNLLYPEHSSLLVIGDTYLIKRLQPPKGFFL